jgi:DNA-3-methyladenine glycosylase
MTVRQRLPRAFYGRPTLKVAEDLIGKVVVHRASDRAHVAGAIVEVEAYIGESDPACHAAPGPTGRNAPLYGPPGIAYVYLNYGMHYLLNAVTEPEGSPAAVLIRALAPLEGLETMRRRRGGRVRVSDDAALARGPGNLGRAFGVTLRQNRMDLVDSSLGIEDWGLAMGPLSWGPRIGIRVGVDRPWRCWVTGHPAVSGRRSTAVVP